MEIHGEKRGQAPKHEGRKGQGGNRKEALPRCCCQESEHLSLLKIVSGRAGEVPLCVNEKLTQGLQHVPSLLSSLGLEWLLSQFTRLKTT